jgi:Tol biopolymer transport system component/DNA-binding winged helix-turn-helix (wHTH) protein
MGNLNSRSSFRLDDWIVEPEFNQLSKGNASRRIEPKVMSVLLQLASQAPHVVAKDEILQAVWPDTFVGEDVLTRCISVLRRVLEDDPHNPRFIKTVSKVGYCLLVVGLPLESPPAQLSHLEAPQLQEEKEGLSSASGAEENIPASAPSEHVAAGRGFGISSRVAALALAGTIGLAIWAALAIRSKSTPTIRTVQATMSAGEQSRPALSPDGQRLAFVWAKEDGSRQHIYIKDLGSESLLRLTDLPDDEYSPVWSPDGKQIAFLSSSESGLGLYVATLGATPSVRKIYIPGVPTRWSEGALSWSSDGKSFALVDHIGGEPSSSIYLIDAKTLSARALTSPPPGWEGDLNPVFSPDSREIAFLRASENAVQDIYWIPSQGGEPHQITHDGKAISGIAWSSDGQSIVFSSDRAGQEALYTVSLNGGGPQRMPVGTENATQPVVSRNGKYLAFVQGSAIFGILRVFPVSTQSRGVEEPLIVSSTAGDSAPSISPDGSQFAFQSLRSGTQQIWVCSINGQSLRLLTSSGEGLSGSGSPSWSPDGDRILFDSRISGHSHIFVIPANGGNPRQLTFGESNDIVPRWSADAHSVYFRSNRGGRWQLWKLPANGGMPQPVTSDDGIAAQESPDGKWLYFARGGESGIWQMPVSGGEVTRILDQPAAGYWAYWTVSARGIYFLDQRQSMPSISLYDPVTKRVTTFAKLKRLPPLYSGLSLLPNGRELLMSDKRDAGSHISIAQGQF